MQNQDLKKERDIKAEYDKQRGSATAYIFVCWYRET